MVCRGAFCIFRLGLRASGRFNNIVFAVNLVSFPATYIGPELACGKALHSSGPKQKSGYETTVNLR